MVSGGFEIVVVYTGWWLKVAGTISNDNTGW